MKEASRECIFYVSERMFILYIDNLRFKRGRTGPEVGISGVGTVGSDRCTEGK